MIRDALMADINATAPGRKKRKGAQRARSVEMPALQMRAEFRPDTLDTEKRTVQVTWTTGAPVLRSPWFDDPYYETLSLDPKHVRMGRLQSGTAPLLNSHRSYDINDIIGVVESATLDPGGRSGSAVVRFARTPDGDQAMGMVADRVLRNVSVGYRTYQMERIKAEDDDDFDTYRAVDWEPYELSMVPIGADAGAATRGAGAASSTNACEFIEERAMDPEQQQTTTTTTANPAPAPAPAPTPTAEQRAAIVAAERQRIAEIQRAGTALGRPQAEIDQAINGGTSADEFRKLAIDARANAPASQGGTIGLDKRDPRIESGEDSRDKWLRGATAWLLVRGAMADTVVQHAKVRGEKVELDPGEFRGLKLLDLARECLERGGVSTRRMSPMEIVGAAFTQRSAVGGATTGDFPILLENVMNKTLLAKYGITPDTWRKFCRIGSVTDFRPAKRYRQGTFGVLQPLNEAGEFQNKAIPDGERQSIQAGTKGNKIAITRQTIINDDMGAFLSLASDFGRAAALTIEMDVYATLALNAGLGPVMSDGNTLFHATHGNITAGAALGSNSIDLDRAAMARQKDPSGNEVLSLVPAILVVPTELGGQARQINNGEYDFDALATKNPWVPNKVRNVFRDIVDTARLGAGTTRRYLFADPGEAPTIEVAFLDGQQAPYMEMRQGWEVDGVEWKVRLEYGVGGVDFRGAVTNAGA